MECYLDNAATTRCSDVAVTAVLSAMQTDYGNPSSLHTKGMEAEQIVKGAREKIARTLHAKEKEILFTSGGTESNNLAIFGTAEAKKRSGKRVITTAIEHPSVANPMKRLIELGYDVIFLPVGTDGQIDLAALEEAVNEETILLSLMQVNNEIGTIEPVEKAIQIARAKAKGLTVHVDAIQAYGKLLLTPEKTGIDLLSVSGHKIHGPKGVGFLYVRERTKLFPLLFGGGQQGNLRSGTENVPGIAGLAAAAEESYRDFSEKTERMYALRERLIAECEKIENVRINGGATRETAAPHIVSLSVPGVRSEVLLHALESEGIYVSAGSACSSHKPAVSATLQAIGLPKEFLDATVRFSLSTDTTEEEIIYTAEALRRLIPQLRKFTRH